MIHSTTEYPRFIFLKQTVPAHSYFHGLCEEVVGDDCAVVLSDIEPHVSGRLEYLRGPEYDRRSKLRRGVSWLRYLSKALYVTFRTKGNPTLLIVTQPPFLSLVGYLQFKLRKRRYVLWVDDVWPDIIVRKGIRNEKSFLVRIWKAFNRLTYRYADHVITLGPCMANNVRAYTAPGVQVSVVPTCVASDVIRPIPKAQNAFANRYGQTGKITVLYSGNMGASHDMDSILSAARRMRGRKDIHFMMIGAGEKFESLSDSVAKEKDPNVTILPLQPSDVFPWSLATGDIALACMEPGIEGISMPSKVYASLAAGSAILGICPTNSDLTALIEKCNCGRQVEPQDPQAIVTALTEMVDVPSKLAEMRANARTAAEGEFLLQTCARRVREIILQAEMAGTGEQR
jgi:glycosyltransferase involved in cell wall biosynthesis